jgi:hypothetical protein
MSESEGEFRFQPPHSVWFKFQGQITEQQARNLLGQAVAHSVELPFLLMTVDISEMTGTTPESRRISADLLRSLPPRAIAVLGGTFGQRILAKLVLKATEMLNAGMQVSAFFDGPDAADAWLRQQARRLAVAASQ